MDRGFQRKRIVLCLNFLLVLTTFGLFVGGSNRVGTTLYLNDREVAAVEPQCASCFTPKNIMNQAISHEMHHLQIYAIDHL